MRVKKLLSIAVASLALYGCAHFDQSANDVIRSLISVLYREPEVSDTTLTLPEIDAIVSVTIKNKDGDTLYVSPNAAEAKKFCELLASHVTCVSKSAKNYQSITGSRVIEIRTENMMKPLYSYSINGVNYIEEPLNGVFETTFPVEDIIFQATSGS